jgi:hypothetical protein
MHFTLKMAVLECSFQKHSQGILEVKENTWTCRFIHKGVIKI